MSTQGNKLVRALSAELQQDLVRYLASRLPSEEDARDIAQEAFLRLLRLERTDLIRHPEAYLFRIASNLVHEHWLKSRPRDTGPGVDPEELTSETTPTETLVEQEQAIDTLERALRLLPDKQRIVVVLHRRDGLTYREIADALQISPDMVKKHLIKGLARCREYMRRCRND